MIFSHEFPIRNKLRQKVFDEHLISEDQLVPNLVRYLDQDGFEHNNIYNVAVNLINKVRNQSHIGILDAFLKEYDLSSEEGVTIMCIAESILRIPDASTGDALLRDKLTSADWGKHLGQSKSLFVNASTWAFLLTGKMLNEKSSQKINLLDTLNKIISEGSSVVVRQAIQQAIRLISSHFIIANDIEKAVKISSENDNKIYRYSFDMLGEAAITSEDADRYFEKYMSAIKYLGKLKNNDPVIGPGVSIKLSALHPRYEFSKYKLIFNQLYPRLKSLAFEAQRANISFVIDAEESERLDLQLDLFEKLCNELNIKNWNGLGIAVQAYQKRSFPVIDWIVELAHATGHRIMLRLVKGAYWDSEIRHAQLQGLDNYPVFTRKESTDISYLACAKKILKNTDTIFPMFATHNAHTIASILNFAGNYCDYEFQRLHGMGEQLHSLIINSKEHPLPCRVYAPCGYEKELLPYLVRRLLENGANTSFVNRILDTSIPVEKVAADPIQLLNKKSLIPNSRIPLPRDLYLPHRINSKGLDLEQEKTLKDLKVRIGAYSQNKWHAASVIDGEMRKGNIFDLYCPSNKDKVIGSVVWANEKDVNLAIQCAVQAQSAWNQKSCFDRATYLIRTAELLEAHADELIALCILEAGKTLPNAIAEIREAVDYCRYYAALANKAFKQPILITGASIKVERKGYGAFACISPWNFPLAIFLGQIAAALVTGNSVIAKPAEQTPLIANKAIQLLFKAGIPKSVLQLVIGNGAIGASIVKDPRIAGVVFTGSTAVAHEIRQTLSNGDRCCIPLIAETGGINAMVIDSSALLEQTVSHVIQSAFDSAGQRCSALRVVYVQKDVAEEFIYLLKGAMAELEIGDPAYFSSDIGPVIDHNAKFELELYEQELKKIGKLIYKSSNSSSLDQGHFFLPCTYEIESIHQIKKEAFGPILHVVRYASKEVESVISEINNSGYGLTFGVQSRINSFTKHIGKIVRAGNIYINRNMIGATVGIQPFGGERLSGTGPKAGGPHYLYKFTHESRTLLNQSQPVLSDKNNSKYLATNDEVLIKPSSEINPTRKHEKHTLSLNNTRIDANVFYSMEKQINETLDSCNEQLVKFDRINNSERENYLRHIRDNIITNQDMLAEIYACEFDLEISTAYKELEQSKSVIDDYINYLNKNTRHIIIKNGPTGETNELNLHNRGVFIFYSDKDPYITGYVSTLAASIVAGNSLIIIANKNTLFSSFYLTEILVNTELIARFIYYLPTSNQAVPSQILNDSRVAGYICFSKEAYLSEIEEKIASQKIPLRSIVFDLNNQTTGGLLANVDNLYLICTERTISCNTTAIGGNATLYSLCS